MHELRAGILLLYCQYNTEEAFLHISDTLNFSLRVRTLLGLCLRTYGDYTLLIDSGCYIMYLIGLNVRVEGCPKYYTNTNGGAERIAQGGLPDATRT